MPIFEKQGFRICLLPESKEIGNADVLINDWVFEIKRISKAKKIDNAIIYLFRLAAKQSDNILLHIDQKAHPVSVRSAWILAAKQYPFRHIWVVFMGQLWQLSKPIVLKGEFRFH